MSNSLPTLSPSSIKPIQLKIEPLTPSSFAEFGTAITTPFPHSSIPKPTKAPLSLSDPPRPAHPKHQVNAVFANQKSALKTAPISTCENLYPDTRKTATNESEKLTPSRPLMSMFTCFPRQLTNGNQFQVKILERHPYTTQTFIPLGLAPSRPQRPAGTKFLVIVAPSLPDGDTSAQNIEPKDQSIENPPDLSKVRAFLAEGNMAVTYAAGTWHAPMVVIGEERVDFVVMQFVDGTSRDVEEVLIGGDIAVEVASSEKDDGLWKPKGRGRRKNKRDGKAKL